MHKTFFAVQNNINFFRKSGFWPFTCTHDDTDLYIFWHFIGQCITVHNMRQALQVDRYLIRTGGLVGHRLLGMLVCLRGLLHFTVPPFLIDWRDIVAQRNSPHRLKHPRHHCASHWP